MKDNPKQMDLVEFIHQFERWKQIERWNTLIKEDDEYGIYTD